MVGWLSNIPEVVAVALIGLGGTALAGLGAVVGHLVSARAQARAATVQADANQTSRENALIDQLQEELTNHRRAQDDRMTTQEQRMTDLEARNDLLRDQSDAYRDLLHKHRAHIYDQKPPPPPVWPDHLPR